VSRSARASASTAAVIASTAVIFVATTIPLISRDSLPPVGAKRGKFSNCHHCKTQNHRDRESPHHRFPS